MPAQWKSFRPSCPSLTDNIHCFAAFKPRTKSGASLKGCTEGIGISSPFRPLNQECPEEQILSPRPPLLRMPDPPEGARGVRQGVAPPSRQKKLKRLPLATSVDESPVGTTRFASFVVAAAGKGGGKSTQRRKRAKAQRGNLEHGGTVAQRTRRTGVKNPGFYRPTL